MLTQTLPPTIMIFHLLNDIYISLSAFNLGLFHIYRRLQRRNYNSFLLLPLPLVAHFFFAVSCLFVFSQQFQQTTATEFSLIFRRLDFSDINTLCPIDNTLHPVNTILSVEIQIYQAKQAIQKGYVAIITFYTHNSLLVSFLK